MLLAFLPGNSMTARRKHVVDLREMIRRFLLGQGDRCIARDLAVSRNTVRKYRAWARQQGFLNIPELPALGVIEERLKTSAPPPEAGPASTVEPYRAFVIEKRAEGVEIMALWGLLKERGFPGHYSSVRRFVNGLEGKRPETYVRVETKPGEEAQVDFGYAGKQYDPCQQRDRSCWTFVMTLSFSRHQYVETVFDQKIETWCELHVRAFEFFGGVVKTIKIDNLKAAIVRAVVHDPEVQRSYRELAEHYGFIISPCRPRTPRHKGKVESGVHYVHRNALAGRSFPTIQERNAYLVGWVMQVAGVRDHGTTHEAPLERFEKERPFLGLLAPDRYEVVVWKEAKLHPDCHVVFESNYYSAPFRLVGQRLLIRVLPRRIELYHHHERVATHPRAVGRGVRVTHNDHLPSHKVQGLQPHQAQVRSRAQEIGPATSEVVERLLGDRPLDRLRTALALIRMAKRFGEARLEAACKRALAFDEPRYHVIKNILDKGLEAQPLEELGPAALPKTSLFARTIQDLTPKKSI
jgi:transposase